MSTYREIVTSWACENGVTFSIATLEDLLRRLEPGEDIDVECAWPAGTFRPSANPTSQVLAATEEPRLNGRGRS